MEVTGDSDDHLKLHVNLLHVQIQYGHEPDRVEVTKKGEDISYEGYGVDKAHSGLFNIVRGSGSLE